MNLSKDVKLKRKSPLEGRETNHFTKQKIKVGHFSYKWEFTQTLLAWECGFIVRSLMKW